MGRDGEYKKQRKGGKKVSPPCASSRQTAGMSKKKPHPPTPHTREGGNNRGVVREESTLVGPSEAGVQRPRHDEGWGRVATTKGGRQSLPWQGKRKSQKVGLGLSMAEKRRRGKAKTLSPRAAKQRRVGGRLWGGRGGPTSKATSPPTPANQGS